MVAPKVQEMACAIRKAPKTVEQMAQQKEFQRALWKAAKREESTTLAQMMADGKMKAPHFLDTHKKP